MSTAESTPRNNPIRYAFGTVLIVAASTLTTCTQQPQVNLSAALSGIDKSRFLTCSGPPSLEIPEGSQDRMWFVANLRRGQNIGVLSPTADPVESCSVAAVFTNARLTSSTFSGNQSMCQVVFGPCLPK
jgi:hypothetical protein